MKDGEGATCSNRYPCEFAMDGEIIVNWRLEDNLTFLGNFAPRPPRHSSATKPGQAAALQSVVAKSD